MSNQVKPAESDVQILKRELLRTRWFAMGIFGIVIFAYVFQFGLLPWLIKNEYWSAKWTVGSGNAEIWGQFGDYFGGTLNPIVSAFALYWLAHSVLLQRFAAHAAEAEFARNEEKHAVIKKAAEAEETRRVKEASDTAFINATSTIIAALTADITYKRDNLMSVCTQIYADVNTIPIHFLGIEVPNKQARAIVVELQDELSRCYAKRDEQIALLKERMKSI